MSQHDSLNIYVNVAMLKQTYYYGLQELEIRTKTVKSWVEQEGDISL